MPAYNAAAHINEAIESMLSQSFEDFELIVIDDASVDSTSAIIQSFEDKRIKLYTNNQNLGVAETLNVGLSKAKGAFIARMDADDVSLTNRLQVQLEYLESNPHVFAVDVLQHYIDETGNLSGDTNDKVFAPEAIKNLLPWRNCIGHPSIMFRAELVQEIKYRKVVYEDYDLWLRLVAKGLLIAKLNCKCFYFRKHSGSITAKAQLDVSHFKKIAATKQYYLSKLTAAERLQPFNIKVWLAKIKDEATFQFKSLKMKRS